MAVLPRRASGALLEGHIVAMGRSHAAARAAGAAVALAVGRGEHAILVRTGARAGGRAGSRRSRKAGLTGLRALAKRSVVLLLLLLLTERPARLRKALRVALCHATRAVHLAWLSTRRTLESRLALMRTMRRALRETSRSSAGSGAHGKRLRRCHAWLAKG